MLSEILSFFDAVFKHWIYIVIGGGIFAAIQFMKLFKKKGLFEKNFKWPVLIVSLFIACFLAWKDEHGKAKEIPLLRDKIVNAEKTISNHQATINDLNKKLTWKNSRKEQVVGDTYDIKTQNQSGGLAIGKVEHLNLLGSPGMELSQEDKTNLEPYVDGCKNKHSEIIVLQGGNQQLANAIKNHLTSKGLDVEISPKFHLKNPLFKGVEYNIENCWFRVGR